MKTGASWPMNSRGGQKNFFPDKSNRSVSCKCEGGGWGRKTDNFCLNWKDIQNVLFILSLVLSYFTINVKGIREYGQGWNYVTMRRHHGCRRRGKLFIIECFKFAGKCIL